VRNTVVGVLDGPVQLDEDSTLDLAWRVTVRVEDAAGAPVPGARIEARDTAGATVFTATTDETGAIAPQPVAIVTRTGETTVRRTPHTIQVMTAGAGVVTKTVEVTAHQTVTVTLPKS
jgi:hypothetical protein